MIFFSFVEEEEMGELGARTRRDWVVRIEEERMPAMRCTQEEEFWKRRSIYRVPTHVTALNQKAYMPQMVALGPYHHNEKHLEAMEEHKKRALLHLLERTNKRLQDFVTPLEEVVQQLMDSYEKLHVGWRDRDKFLEMMTIDGCFLLEILHATEGIPNDYPHNDPIFSDHGMFCKMPYIRRDMLMIENQIPLSVLLKLEAVAKGTTENDKCLIKLILKFCNDNSNIPEELVDIAGLHVLDVYRTSMLLGPCQKHIPRQASTGEIMRSATELREGGIHFRKSQTNSLKDIKFERFGVLKLPTITIDDATEHIFLNLMAFERLHCGTGTEVTSYIFFMDNIIDTAKDVHLLRSRGIITNALGSDEEVAKLFNNICIDMTLDPKCTLSYLHQDMNRYCRKRYNRWMANLRHYYIHNPWATISIIAAIFLLLLTTLQTVYTLLSYYKPH